MKKIFIFAILALAMSSCVPPRNGSRNNRGDNQSENSDRYEQSNDRYQQNSSRNQGSNRQW